MFKYEEAVLKWAKDRNLIEGGTIAGQYRKLMEEAGELGEALILNDDVEIADAIGDMAVVLIILADMNEFSFEGCIAQAYDQIKDRKGRMVNGVFVKHEEVKSEQAQEQAGQAERPVFAGT